MPDTINGVGVPQFTILEADNAFIKTYTFPRCNIGGNEEENTKDNIIHVLETGEILQRVKGYRYKFTLDYSVFLLGDYQLMLKEILNFEKQQKKIMFNPHIDSLNRLIKVIFSNNPLKHKPLPTGTGRFKFMQGLVIDLLSVDLLDINWIDADQLSIPLDGFTLS